MNKKVCVIFRNDEFLDNDVRVEIIDNSTNHANRMNLLVQYSF